MARGERVGGAADAFRFMWDNPGEVLVTNTERFYRMDMEDGLQTRHDEHGAWQAYAPGSPNAHGRFLELTFFRWEETNSRRVTKNSKLDAVAAKFGCHQDRVRELIDAILEESENRCLE